MIRYATPKKGLFEIPTGNYDKVKYRWEQRIETLAIIGETKYDYITEFRETSCGYWDEYGQYEAHYTLPLGVHKSRFIEWDKQPTQLQIF